VEIEFTLPAALHARLEVFDLQGREVARLLDEMRPAGRHRVNWNPGAAEAGRSGVYFVRLEANRVALTRRLALLR
jgi:hypothetical protein